MIIHNPILTGSFSVNGADLSTITGSVATSASFDARTTYLESTSSILTAASASQSVTSGSLVAASASLSATSGSLSAASGSFNTRVSALEVTGSALSSSLLTVSGSGYATSGSLNTRVSALEVTGSALSSSLLTVSGSGYATSASLSAASGSFNTRVATIESKYATTGSNTFIGTQVVSGSILQSGSFTSTGTLTAQTLVIQTITSSVVYSSGSNVFGNSLGNSQVFTGSVLITGSLALAGNITSNGTAVVLGSGTSGYLPKFTGTSAVGNSIVQDASTYIDVAGYAYFRRGGKYIIINPNVGSANAYADIGVDTGMGITFTPNAGSAAMTLTSSGNLGLGVTPSAWMSGSTALQVVRGGLWHDGSGYLAMFNNAYYDGSNWRYIASTTATVYNQVNGANQWSIASTGTAGNIVSFTQAMTLDANGDLQIGTTTTSGERLTVYGSSEGAVIFQNSTSGTGSANGLYLGVLNSENYLWTYENQPIIFGTSNGEKMRLDASGNLGLGVTPSAWSGITALQIGGYASFGGDSSFVTYVSSNAYYNAGWKYIGVSAAANYYQDAGGHYFRSTSTTGTAGGAITWITPLTIASTGAATFSSTITGTTIHGSTMVCAASLKAQSGFADLVLCGSNTTSPHIGGNFTITTNQDGNGRTIIGNSAVGRAMYLEAGGTFTFLCAATFNSTIGATGANISTSTICTSASTTLGSSRGIIVDVNTTTNNAFVPIGFSWASSISSYNPTWGMALKTINYNAGTADLVFYTGGDNVRLTIGNGGAATFSSSVTAGGDITANAGSSTAITVYNASSIRGKLSMTGNEGDLTLYGSSANAKIYLSAYYDSYFNGGAVFIHHPSNLGEGKLRVSQDGSYWNTEIRHTYSTQYFMLFRYCSTGIGSIVGNGSTVAFNTSSDYRLKEDLKEVNGLEKIAAIKIYNYKWKNNDLRMDGVLAHELSNVLPYAVTGDKDALDKDGNINPQGVDYSKLAPVIVKAIQEQQCTICTQASMINTLKTCLGII